jgi:hypothetical protein
MGTGGTVTMMAGSRAPRVRRAAVAAALLVMPLFVTACAGPPPSACDLAQKVAEAESDSTAANDAYRDLAVEWATPGAPPFGDTNAQAAANAMIDAHDNGDPVAYGTAKKSFDFYVLSHCAVDVSSAQYE